MYLLDTPSLSTHVFKNKGSTGCESPRLQYTPLSLTLEATQGGGSKRYPGPQTNGKAGRFIQTCLREWAYGRVWDNSAERTAWLPAFLAYYNARRPHSALGYKPPASRLAGNNLLQLNN